MLLLGLDIGTDAAHAVAIDETGAVVASASREYATRSPRPGWIEGDPADWWRAALQVLSRVAADERGQIGAVGLAGHHGSVFVDAAGAPVRPAILGGDRRAASQAGRIRERIGAQRVIEITGSPALADHQAAIILWLRDVEPVQFRHTRRVLLPKDHARLMLTGEAATDVSDAAGTLLMDFRRRTWAHEMLDSLEIPPEWMPLVHSSLEIAGGLRPSIARELGLPPGLPVAAGASETAAAAVSKGIVTTGLIGSSIDSSGLLIAPTADAIIDPGGQLQTACDPSPQRYDLMGTVPSAGASLRWWRDVLGQRLDYEELCAQAETVPAGADGLFFVPHIDGKGAARHDAVARGAFVGLRAHHTPADLTRGLMEGVIFRLRDRLDVMRGLGIEAQQVRATGGGARSRLWRQMQADIFAVPVAAMASVPNPAVGAALLAGVATGVFADVAAAGATVARLGSVLEPDPERTARYEQLYRTFWALDPAIREPAAPRPT
ncbi:MAG TPA: xylulokinase [Candidatus Dormibacteraeota bacterium]|nr:xylulokinase [Candidatus Dormibacteraeota bacterium]